MESLARTVVLLVGWLVLLGPLGVVFGWSQIPIPALVLGALSVISGLAYLVAIPSAPVWLGMWAAMTGVYAVHLGMLTFLRTREQD